MATRKRVSVKKPGEQKRMLSYEKLMDITGGRTLDELSEDEWYNLNLHKLGFGSWLKRNVANVGMGLAGVGLLATGNPMGVGLLTSGVSGIASDSKEQKDIKEQNVLTQQMQRDNELQALNNQIRNDPNANSSNFSPVMAYGGTINYEGQTHEGKNGGIPIDGMGNPVKGKPIALVENKEVSIDLGPELGTYVFSDRLSLNDKRSFAKEAKRIQNRYKLHAKNTGGVFKVTDPISRKGYEEEMINLVEKQEILKDALAEKQKAGKIDFRKVKPRAMQENVVDNTMQGVPTPDESIPMAASGIHIDPSKRGTFKAQATRMKMSVQEAASYILAHPDKYSPAMRKKANFARNFAKQEGGSLTYLSTIPQGFIPQILPQTIPQVTADSLPQSFFPKRSSTVSSITPYQGMSEWQAGLSALPGVASGIANMIRSRQRNPYKPISLPTIQAQTINLEPERAALREQANLSEANISRNLLAAAPTAGGYMANMINANTGVRRGYGQDLSKSYLNEAQYNAQARQQADMMNAEMRAQQEMYNSQLRNSWRERGDQLFSAGLSQIGQGITGALNQYQGSRADAMKLGMINPDYYYTQTIPGDSWFKRNFGRRDVNIAVRPETLERLKRDKEELQRKIAELEKTYGKQSE